MTLDLKFYLSIFLRRLPYFLIVAVTVTAIGVSVALILPPKYRASALLLLESEQIPGDLAASTVRTGAPEQLEIIKQRLMTRANLLEIAERFAIYAGAPDLNPTEIVDDMRERTEILSAVGRQTGVTTVTVSFEGATAAQALQVTNEVVTLILQENVEMRTGSATQTLEFFQQEVDRLGASLDRQEAALLEFRTTYQDSLPDSLNYRRARQATLQERLLQLQREEGALNDRRARLVDLYERTGRVEPGTAPLSPEQQRLQDLRAELERALLIYSPQNPRVKTLQAQLAALEQGLPGAAPDDEGDQGGAVGGEPSLYELQLAQIDGDLEYLADQKAQTEAELEALRVSIEATPANAAQLSELERTYEITQGQYTQAVSRLAQARTGERIEVLSKGQRITVIEQPVLPTKPDSPNRKLIAAGSLLVGIALGLGQVLLLELLNRSIRRPAEIVSALGITPIATLPLVRTSGERVIRRGVIVMAFGIAIFGISGGLYALDTYYMPMDLLLERVIDKVGLGPLLNQIQQGLSG
jgi:polysaccharide chain length determinant protein (PEP-CTERM system associated)